MISFRIARKHIEQAKIKYETTDNSANLHDRSVLEKLLRIDKQTAQVMALDMLTAGVDTVSAGFQDFNSSIFFRTKAHLFQSTK